MTHITGGCLCRAVRYVITAEPLPCRQFLCCCDDCQRYTGKAFLSGMAFPPASIELTGEMTTFTMPGGQSDEPSLFTPELCVFCESAPSWLHLPSDAKKLLRYR